MAAFQPLSNPPPAGHIQIKSLTFIRSGAAIGVYDKDAAIEIRLYADPSLWLCDKARHQRSAERSEA
jgi:hypothetical protein